jgi:hypothetical protein
MNLVAAPRSFAAYVCVNPIPREIRDHHRRHAGARRRGAGERRGVGHDESDVALDEEPGLLVRARVERRVEVARVAIVFAASSAGCRLRHPGVHRPRSRSNGTRHRAIEQPPRRRVADQDPEIGTPAAEAR